MKFFPQNLLFLAALACASTLASAEVVKIGYIDPFSGSGSAVNENYFRTVKMFADIANKEKWAGANTFEIVEFDSKSSPQEAVQQLKRATDQGIRYFVQGLSSSVGLALVDAIGNFNARNPGKELLYLNATNQSPDFTNDKCSYWSFSFETNTSLRTQALVSTLSKDSTIKKVYLINMNYATGQSVSNEVKIHLKTVRPDITVVGDDLHPMFQVKDFSPYVSKIKASGADVIVTGNWGGDLTLLIKAAKDANLSTPFYTYNAISKGAPTALASAEAKNLRAVYPINPSDNKIMPKALVEQFRAQYDDELFSLNQYNLIKMLASSIKAGNSTDVASVAKHLEGMKIEGFTGPLEMRKSDHAIQQPLYIASWAKSNGGDVYYDLEKTGYGFKTVEKLEPASFAQASTCQMKRP